VKNETGHFRISSRLIKQLVKEEKAKLLDIIFKNFKFFDLELIRNLLLFYKNKKTLSPVDFNQLFLKEKYRIPCINKSNSCIQYLIDACNKGDERFVKYLIQHGIDVNDINYNSYTPLLAAFKKGNESIVRYLVEQGA